MALPKTHDPKTSDMFAPPPVPVAKTPSDEPIRHTAMLEMHGRIVDFDTLVKRVRDLKLPQAERDQRIKRYLFDLAGRLADLQIDTPKEPCAVRKALTALNQHQHSVRTHEDASPEARAVSEQLANDLLSTLGGERAHILRRRVAVNPRDDKALLKMSITPELDYMRAIVRAADADAGSNGRSWALAQLSALQGCAMENRRYLALNTLATELDKLAKEYAAPERWSASRDTIRQRIELLVTNYEPLAVNRRGQASEQVAHVPDAASADELHEVSNYLRLLVVKHARFALDGLAQAYHEDEKAIARRDRSFHDQNKESPDSPFAMPNELLSLAYRAAWAQAADGVAKNMKRFCGTVDNPLVSSEMLPPLSKMAASHVSSAARGR